MVGNPFRPLTLPLSWVCANCDGQGYFVRNNGSRFDCRSCGGKGKGCPWLTRDVTALAHAAHEERPGRKCEKCGGAGGYWPGNVSLGNLTDENWKRCEVCHGAGRIEDGALDPVRLLVLADALEEAGCTDEAVLLHLRGRERCPKCAGRGYLDDPGTAIGWRWCDCDDDNCIAKRAPCVRGCFVIDTILGRE